MPPALHTEHTPDHITPHAPRLPQTEGQSLPGSQGAALVLLLATASLIDDLRSAVAGPLAEEVATLNPNPGTRSPV